MIAIDIRGWPFCCFSRHFVALAKRPLFPMRPTGTMLTLAERRLKSQLDTRKHATCCRIDWPSISLWTTTNSRLLSVFEHGNFTASSSLANVSSTLAFGVPTSRARVTNLYAFLAALFAWTRNGSRVRLHIATSCSQLASTTWPIDACATTYSGKVQVTRWRRQPRA